MLTDLEALTVLAARSPSRQQIIVDGFRGLVGSSDLQPYGYQIRHWYRLADGAQIVEYNPIHIRDWKTKETIKEFKLPRVAISTYQDQAALHLALGLNLVPPGEQWQDYRGAGLFDELLMETANDGKTSEPERTEAIEVQALQRHG